MRHGIIAACIALALVLVSSVSWAADLMDFWDTPRHGANSFNRLPPDDAYFKALAGYGATWVRLSYDKWTPTRRDFLLGDADDYNGLERADLATLRSVLDRAHRAGLRVVIAPLSLPGMRWAQNNEGQFDDRLWTDQAHWPQAAAFWRDLAEALADHPAVAAYNLVNEPAPERNGGLAEHASADAMRRWYAQQVGTGRDLPAFYTQVLAALRTADPLTPVMLDAGWYAAADAFDYWPKALADARLLYSVHMYEPYAATSAPNLSRAQPYPYPGRVPFAGASQQWDRQQVARYLTRPLKWVEQQGLPATRLVVGEFGCMRRLPGCGQYLDDVLTELDRQQVHWAFYAFREDAWDGMDYELGTTKVPWRYWQAAERGAPDPVLRASTPLFDIIRRRLRPDG